MQSELDRYLFEDCRAYAANARLYQVLKTTNMLGGSGSGSHPSGSTSGIRSLDERVQEGAKNFSAGQVHVLDI